MNHDNLALRATCSVLLKHENGLHARPSILLTQHANRFASQVSIGTSEEGPWTDAKSITRVITLKTPSGTRLFFAAEGPDAEDAVRSLAKLVANDFTADTKLNDE
jgi:phosphocarrier protein HPr